MSRALRRLKDLTPGPFPKGNGSRDQRANPVSRLLSGPIEARYGLPAEWAPSSYGDYLAANPTVYACIDLRSRNLARVDLRVYAASTQAGGQATTVGESHTAQRLLSRPNPFWSAQRFWYVVEASLCLWGSAPVAMFRDRQGAVRELWWLHPSRFKVVPDPSEYIRGYLYEKDGGEVAFRPEEVLWFRYPNPLQEYAGLSPMAALRMTVDMNVDAIRYNRRFFQNDGTPGRVYLKTDQSLTTAQAEELRARWERAFKGPTRSHTIAIMDRNADLKTLSGTQREMEFIEGQRFSKEEICGAFGVSPVLIGDLRNATLNNFRVAKTTFWDETMLPEMQLIESELDQALLPHLGQGLTARFDVTEVSSLREDANARAARYKLLVDAGIMTVDEVREREGLGPRRS